MRKLLLIHTFRNPLDGAYIRVKNIGSAFTQHCNADSTEIVLTSMRFFSVVYRGDQVPPLFTKRIFLPILWTNRHLLARIWNAASAWAIGLLIALLCRPHIVLSETSSAWRLASAIKRWRPGSVLVMDLHGAGPEEVLVHYQVATTRDAAFKLESALEQRIFHGSDIITCQSQNMMDHLYSKYGQSKAKLHPFQCSVRLDRFFFDPNLRRAFRDRLGLAEEDILFVYCGSLHKWQNLEYSVEVFAEFHKAITSSSKLLILCSDSGQTLRSHARSLGLPDQDVTIIRVPHEEVPAYLCAADIGFLIRNDDVVNQVASPTKLGEYLSCGLPVIVGRVAGSWPSAALDPTCFCSVDLGETKKAAETVSDYLKEVGLSPVIRQRAMNLAFRTLSNTSEAERLEFFIRHTVLETLLCE